MLLAAVVISGFPALGEVRPVLDFSQLPPKGRTLVWSPLFQASWDKLNRMHGGKPEKVVPPNALIALLDQFQWKEDEVMPKKGYATFAGPATPEFAQATAAGIRRQFGVEMTPSNLPTVPRGEAVYGILVRNLGFQKSFIRSQKVPLRFKDSTGATHEATFFGVAGSQSDNYGGSVKVLDYRAREGSFILRIATERADETLIIYRPDQALSFEKAIADVESALKAPFDGPYGSLTDSTLHKQDTVKIPDLSLNASMFFTSRLKGARHYAGEDLPYEIGIAYQIAQFGLSEKGVRIRVETRIFDVPFGEPSAPQRVTHVGRSFVCDAPFFVFAWREEATWPYLAAWIDGNAALRSFPGE